MRAQFVGVILAIGLVMTVAGQSLPDHCAILPLSKGPALMKQCSRSTPKGATGFWSPSPSQVIAIEKLLPEMLRKSGHNLKLSDSNRQYIGITVHGKNLIYLNSFHRTVLSELGKHLDWRTQAIIICDGGDAFWGVVFDPANNTFHELQFNGIA